VPVIDLRVAVFIAKTDRQIEHTVGDHTVDDSKVIEKLEAARLHTFAARTVGRRRCGIDDPNGRSGPDERAGKRQPGRAGSDDEDVAFAHVQFPLTRLNIF
jgi:hypothetical protein